MVSKIKLYVIGEDGDINNQISIGRYAHENILKDYKEKEIIKFASVLASEEEMKNLKNNEIDIEEGIDELLGDGEDEY